MSLLPLLVALLGVLLSRWSGECASLAVGQPEQPLPTALPHVASPSTPTSAPAPAASPEGAPAPAPTPAPTSLPMTPMPAVSKPQVQPQGHSRGQPEEQQQGQPLVQQQGQPRGQPEGQQQGQVQLQGQPQGQPRVQPQGQPQAHAEGQPQGQPQGQSAVPAAVPAVAPGPAPVVGVAPLPGVGGVVAETATGLPVTTEPEPEAEPEDRSSASAACVHVSDAHCPPVGALCRCRLVNATSTAVCCDVTTQLQLMESLNCEVLAGATIVALHARNITLHSLDLGVLDMTRLSLPQLESLAITDGHITEINGNLSAKNLACFNLSSNSLINVSNENTFLSLPSLTYLDLSGNALQQINNITPYNATSDVPELYLDISGNDKLSCESTMELLKKMTNLQFMHDNTTFCLTPHSFHWFNTTERIPISSVIMLNKMEEECPRGETGPCICSKNRLTIVPGKPPIFLVNVDCSNRRLTSLPKTLPKNTVHLNVSFNSISNLEELSMNSAYTDLRMLYADDNQITSITVLEGSTFINSFMSLSLRNNNITSLPTYILSNVFDRNDYGTTLHLGLNRLKCDCSTAQSIKMWLTANYRHIPDYTEVLCENMPEKVYELDQNKVCTVQSDWTEYIYYLVALEVLLLVLLISKVSYDYWVFKTTGYLPCPASKMPKLPCDWVFES